MPTVRKSVLREVFGFNPHYISQKPYLEHLREGTLQHVAGCPHRRPLGNPRAELPHEIADEPLGIKRPHANVE